MLGLSRLATFLAEFLGTATLVLVLLAVNKSGVGFSIFIALGVALALAGLLFATGRFAVGHFNPATTLGLWTVRRIPTLDAVVYLVAQFLGAFAAWRLYTYLTNQALKNIASSGFEWRVFLAEIIGAFVFTFIVTAALQQAFTPAKWVAAAALGVFVAMLLASLGSNGLANPALAFGVRSWDWNYVLGPLVGGIVGANLYTWVFAPSVAGGSVVTRRSATAGAKVAAKPARRATAARKTTARSTSRSSAARRTRR